MISVDCTKVLSIKDQLLVHVSDKLQALPIMKSNKFILTPIDEGKKIEKQDVLSAINDFLESSQLKENFQIIPKGDEIKLEPYGGKDFKEKLEKLSMADKIPFFECTHCGFMTQKTFFFYK